MISRSFNSLATASIVHYKLSFILCCHCDGINQRQSNFFFIPSSGYGKSSTCFPGRTFIFTVAIHSRFVDWSLWLMFFINRNHRLCLVNFKSWKIYVNFLREYIFYFFAFYFDGKQMPPPEILRYILAMNPVVVS